MVIPSSRSVLTMIIKSVMLSRSSKLKVIIIHLKIKLSKVSNITLYLAPSASLTTDSVASTTDVANESEPIEGIDQEGNN